MLWEWWAHWLILEGFWLHSPAPCRLLLAYKADPILRNRQGLLPSDLIMCHQVPCVADGCEVPADFWGSCGGRMKGLRMVCGGFPWSELGFW